MQVVGRLKTETWTDKVTNQPRKTIKIVADQVNRVRSIGQVCWTQLDLLRQLVTALAGHWHFSAA